MPQTTSPATRICTYCGAQKPLRHFRRMRRGTEQRHPQCNGCRNVEERQRRLQKQYRGMRSDLAKLRRLRDVGEIAAFLRAMLAKAGGLEGFTTRVWEFFEAPSRSDGFKARVIIATIHLMLKLSEAQARLRPPADQASEDELVDVLHRGIVRAARAGELDDVLRALVETGEVQVPAGV